MVWKGSKIRDDVKFKKSLEGRKLMKQDTGEGCGDDVFGEQTPFE